LVPDGAGIGVVGEARRRRHRGDYVEEAQRSSRRRDQARWYRFIIYTPLGCCADGAAFGAARGRLPDAAMRKRMEQFIDNV